jgi:hypothetical protein
MMSDLIERFRINPVRGLHPDARCADWDWELDRHGTPTGAVVNHLTCPSCGETDEITYPEGTPDLPHLIVCVGCETDMEEGLYVPRVIRLGSDL